MDDDPGQHDGHDTPIDNHGHPRCHPCLARHGRRNQDVDTSDQLALFLERNPGVCQVAEYQGRIIGLSIAGHDGRRGTLHHIGVALAYRRNGIGRTLVECSFDVLRTQGQHRVHNQFKESNATALRFWKAFGVREQNDLVMISLQLGVRKKAVLTEPRNERSGVMFPASQVTSDKLRLSRRLCR